MVRKANIVVDPAYKIGKIEERLFGSFLEPIGDFVTGGIWNPNHPEADENGFRKDMLRAVKEFDVPAIRLPGGNFMSGWKWDDSIGPRENRKAHLDLAWKQYETNQVGHDEYLTWAEKAGVETLYTLNLGTGTVQDALNCVEYTNHEGGTYWSELRKKNGHKDPYNVKLWYLGNEMDGPWQINSFEKDPKGYGIKAYETAKVIKYMDSSQETAVCGSSSLGLSSYPTWEREVLEECYPLVDYMSLHYYYWAPEGDFTALMNAGRVFEEFLNTEISICDYVQAKYRTRKKMMISFDEYGANFHKQDDFSYAHYGHLPLTSYAEFQEGRNRPFFQIDLSKPGRKFPPRGQMLDTLGLSSVLLMMLRHADRVKIGCMTGGIMSAIAHDRDNVWKGAAYFPFYQLRHYAKGQAILPAVTCDTFNTKGFIVDNLHCADPYEGTPFVDTAASYDEESGEAAVFIINRDWENDAEITLDLRGFEGYTLVSHEEMFTEDLSVGNSYGNEVLRPRENPDTKMEGGKVTLLARKLSWNVVRLKKA